MTDIQPALTPEQWKREAWENTRTTGPDWIQETTIQGVAGAVVIQREYPSHRHCVDAMTVKEHELPAILALANHALPDDDPHKLTAADAEAAHAIATNSGAWTDENREIVERLARKLFSLLPTAPRGARCTSTSSGWNQARR